MCVCVCVCVYVCVCANFPYVCIYMYVVFLGKIHIYIYVCVCVYNIEKDRETGRHGGLTNSPGHASSSVDIGGFALPSVRRNNEPSSRFCQGP